MGARLEGMDARVAEAESAGVVVSREVRQALVRGGAVVALESTIICHGMPYPDNLRVAMDVEATVRQRGAVPATIAIVDGVPHVGLSAQQLEALARMGVKARKTARRDIALVVSQRLTGATTVSATMFFAHMVGIHVFVTGGIGGVHRDGQSTMDVSSDLTELGRTPVAVVCAGVKSVLDISRTLEYLETQGVTVAALGTDVFPAFFSQESGCRASSRVDTAEGFARLIAANLQLKLGSGMVVAVPPPEAEAARGGEVEAATQQALNEAKEQGVTGADITPFLLARIKQLTGGASLAANIALVKNNARVGAHIAVALASLLHPSSSRL